ncbi:Rieske (2Fe-2S) protein [Streptomyces sp. NPDC003077]|uniref:QcrA and Rieske domain-containing protein n=1 Tax=Streptomyces sp. NPDC003077 TaxID=3154443 RepID=UPI0033B14075
MSTTGQAGGGAPPDRTPTGSTASPERWAEGTALRKELEEAREQRALQDEAALHDRLAADSLTTRRDYLRIVTTVSGGLAVSGLAVAAGVLPRHGEGSAPPKRVAAHIPAGRSVAFRYPGAEDRAVAIRLSDGSLVGYSAVCTHLACAVLWRRDRGMEGELYCPCHEGAFDARTGEVAGGPPPRGLPKVILYERDDGSIWAIGTARSGESEEEGMCRQLLADDPKIAEEVGCPGAEPGHGDDEVTEDALERRRTAEGTSSRG